MMPRDRELEQPVAEQKRVYSGRIWDVLRDEVELDPGRRVERDYVAHPGAVAILALDADERVVLVQQYRHPVRAQLWEIPAGLLDVAGEDPLDAAKRELWEEADLRAGHWEHLIDFYTTPGGSDEKLRIYLARDLSEVSAGERYQRTDEEQGMQIRLFPIEAVIDSILSGGIMNPSTVVGALAYYRKFQAPGAART